MNEIYNSINLLIFQFFRVQIMEHFIIELDLAEYLFKKNTIVTEYYINFNICEITAKSVNQTSDYGKYDA